MHAPVSQDPYNLKLGAVRFNFSAGLTTEYNDNINLAESGGASDLIFGASIATQGEWKVTANNALRITLSLGYQKYLDHPQFDNLAVSVGPQSQISYDIFVVGVMKITLHDSFSVTQDPIEQPTLSNVVSFRTFQNTTGATALWDWNKLILTLGYDHFLDTSLDSAFAYDNHSAESVNASAALRVSAATTTGIDTSANYSYYEQNFHNPSIAFSGGPFIEQKLSRYLDLRVSGGIQEIQFKSGGTNGDSSSLNGWYSNISLAHRINRFCTETFVGGHESTLALQTNYQTIDYLRYSLSFKLLKRITTSLNVFYEHVAESPGLKSETLDQFGGGLQLGYQLTKKLSLNGGCQTVTKQSNISGSNYLQNRVFLGAQYQF